MQTSSANNDGLRGYTWGPRVAKSIKIELKSQSTKDIRNCFLRQSKKRPCWGGYFPGSKMRKFARSFLFVSIPVYF